MNQVISADGTRIGFERRGSGSPLVLVHGGTVDHTCWAAVMPALAEHFTVYAMDRRGCGLSGDAESYALEREFEDVVAVVDDIGGPVDLLGHSFGAVCALEAARRTPNIRRLVIYEPPPTGVAGYFPPDAVARTKEVLATGDRDGALSTFYLEVCEMPPAELEAERSRPDWPGHVAAVHAIVREMHALEAYPPFDPADYASLRPPTLFLVGGDCPERCEVSPVLAPAMPDSRIVVMPGQQHMAMETAPDLFVREVLAFLLDPMTSADAH